MFRNAALTQRKARRIQVYRTALTARRVSGGGDDARSPRLRPRAPAAGCPSIGVPGEDAEPSMATPEAVPGRTEAGVRGVRAHEAAVVRERAQLPSTLQFGSDPSRAMLSPGIQVRQSACVGSPQRGTSIRPCSRRGRRTRLCSSAIDASQPMRAFRFSGSCTPGDEVWTRHQVQLTGPEGDIPCRDAQYTEEP